MGDERRPGEENGQNMTSPALTENGDGRLAYEVKFLVHPDLAEEIQRWANTHMIPDEHGDPQQRGSYGISSLYTDTSQLDVYHRTPKYRRIKFRVRRYGNESTIHLEQKFRKGDTVAKNRTCVPEAELNELSHPMGINSWGGHWFHQSLIQRSLQPSCLLVYQRTAFVGSNDNGPLRLTLDRDIQGERTTEWNVNASERRVPLLSGEVVLELKFRQTMPVLFKQLIASLQLTPTGFSKYRRCIEVCQTSESLDKPEARYA